MDEDARRRAGPPLGRRAGSSAPTAAAPCSSSPSTPVLRFRCRIGHAWTADSLVAQQDVTVETALWTAVRTLQEKAELAERLAARRRGRPAGHRATGSASRPARRTSPHGILKDLLPSMPLDEGERTGTDRLCARDASTLVTPCLGWTRQER